MDSHDGFAPTALADHLQRLTEALSAVHVQADVFSAALEPAVAALGAVAGAVLLLGQRTQHLSVAALQGHGAQTVWKDGPGSVETPAGDVVRTRQPLYFEFAEALQAAYPHLEAQTGGIAPVATAVLPLLLEGRPLGVLILDFREPHTFTPDEKQFLASLASQSALAISRAQLLTALDAQVQERTGELAAEREALQAFVAFNRATAETTDVYVLAERAIEVLRTVLREVSVAYSERAGEVWQARVWSDTLAPDVIEAIQAGLPVTAPNFSEAAASGPAMGAGTSLFVPGFDAAAQGVPQAQSFRAAAFYPCAVNGVVLGLLTMGTEVRLDWSARDRQVFEAVGSSLTLALERAEAAHQLQVQKEEAERRSEVLEAFAALTAELSIWQRPDELILRAQEIVLSLLPEGHALYWEPVDDLWRLRAQTGEVGHPALQAAIEAGIPVGLFPTIDRPWQTGEPEYQDRYAAGRDLPLDWTVQARSVAALPVFRGDTLLGVMNFTLTRAHVWRAADQVVLETVQQSLSLALDRMHQQQVIRQEQTALQAFVRFTTTVASSTDLKVLARAAANTVRDVVDEALGGFYLIRDDVAYPVFLSDNTPAHLVETRQAGISLQLPVMVEMSRRPGTVFSDPEVSLEYSDGYASALSTRFYVRAGRPYAMFTTATRRLSWTEQERAIITSVGQGLALALERVEAAEQVQQQRDEAQRRAQALEAFAVMSRDLAAETGRHALIRRAQEIMLSLLTPGYALYWEEAVDRWALRSQVGDIGDPALQRLVDEHGLPLGTPALHSTWLSGVPNYQDNYAQGADTPAEMIRHVQAATAFRVEVQGRPVGMLAIGLFDQRTWTPMDRAMLETALHSLGLVLERAQSFAALAERTAQLELVNGELEVVNGELEAFAYSVSHDLRTPVRHVKGFAELAQQALSRRPERAEQHLQVVKDAADRMTTMIDAMLNLSQAARTDLRSQSVSLQHLVEQAQRDAELEFPERTVQWEIQALPTVQGDPDTLQQVITNLVTNAVKYGRDQCALQVRIWAEETSQEHRILVRDNGAGFDPQFAGKLFGVFQRLHSQKEFDGTGVGLATVKRIVGRHGGRVWADGLPGQGATFGFSLPRQPHPRRRP